MQTISHPIGSISPVPTQIVSGPPLPPGTHLFELALARPPRDAETLALGLARAGFSRVLVDASDAETVDENEWGVEGRTGSNVFQGPSYRVRAIATASRTLLPTDGPELAWLFSAPVGIDVYAEIEGRAALEPFELRRDGLYEIRFVSRMRSERKEGTRAAVLSLAAGKREPAAFDIHVGPAQPQNFHNAPTRHVEEIAYVL